MEYTIKVRPKKLKNTDAMKNTHPANQNEQDRRFSQTNSDYTSFHNTKEDKLKHKSVGAGAEPENNP